MTWRSRPTTTKHSCARSTRAAPRPADQTVAALRPLDHRRRRAAARRVRRLSSGIGRLSAGDQAEARAIAARCARQPGERQPQRGDRPQLDALAESGSPGYRAAALFAQAPIAGRRERRLQRRRREVDAQIAADEDSTEPYRDAGLIRQTALEFDTLKPEEVDRAPEAAGRAGPALVRQRRRMVGIALLPDEPAPTAGQLFAGSAATRRCRRSIRTRAVQMAGSLGVDALPEPQRQPVPVQTGALPAPRHLPRPSRQRAAAQLKETPNEASRCRPDRRQPARRLRTLGIGGRRPTDDADLGQRIPVLQQRRQHRGRSGARRHSGRAARPDRSTPTGRNRAATPPSRWAMSRWAPRSPRPGASDRQRQQRAGAARRAPVVADGRSSRSTRGPWSAPSTRDTGAHGLGARRSAAEKAPSEHVVRRRRQRIDEWPRLRDQRRRRCRGARRRHRRDALAVKPGGPLRGAPTDRQRQCLCDQPGQPALRAQRRQRRDALAGAGVARVAGVFGIGAPAVAQARSSPASRRASSTPIATRTARSSGRTRWRAPAITTVGRHALRHRRRSGDRQWPRLRGRPGRPHGRARADHRPAGLGAQHRRHLDALGRGRLAVRRSPTRRSCSPCRAPTGKVRWIAQLPPSACRERTPSTPTSPPTTGTIRKDPIFWRGPILAGDRLILVSSRAARSLNVSPTDGRVQSTDARTVADVAVAGGREQHALHPRRQRPIDRLRW